MRFLKSADGSDGALYTFTYRTDIIKFIIKDDLRTQDKADGSCGADIAGISDGKAGGGES